MPNLKPSRARSGTHAWTVRVNQFNVSVGMRAVLLTGSALYGAPVLQFAAGSGTVNVWAAQHGDTTYIAAVIPDSTYYWGDDLVVRLRTACNDART